MALAFLAVIMAFFLGSLWIVRQHLAIFTDPVALRVFVRSFGVLAPLIYIAIQALQVVIAPVPGHMIGFASGYLFGTVNGTAYSLIGTAIGSTIAFGLARRFGRPFVERTIHPDTLEQFDSFVDEHGVMALFTVFLIPGLPDDALCFVGGLTRIPIWQLVVVSVVGRFPGFALANLAGDWLAQRRFVATGILVTVLVVISILGYLARDRIAALADGHRE